MEAAGVPTAGYVVVTDPQAGIAAIDRYPAVIKADGLAAGKGVIIAAGRARRPPRRSTSCWLRASSEPSAW